jgi:hypothetical protein
MSAAHRFVSGLVAAFAAASPASAINWEGHDEWLEDPALHQEFLRDLPPPLVKPLPLCSKREEEAKANAYAQVPVSGVNCNEDRQKVR